MKLPSLTFDNFVIMLGVLISFGGVGLYLWLKNAGYLAVMVLGCTMLIIGLSIYRGGELVE